jgi:cell division protein FtsB
VRTLGLGICLIAILAVSALLDHESGVGIWLGLREDLSGSAARIAQLQRENDEMRNEIQMLEAEPAALDRAIREELDLALPGEVVVRFTTPEGPEDPTPVDDDGDWTLRRLFPPARTDGEPR